ncbi:MAG: hypothetical protein CEN88_156 [Candidatus Berkelbacteria bacterium Licking1014_2]|uniref:Nucleoid-associated protein n=1 Tax=Candidatus Berkelbacteria bacterium Licking1014_2 TaxID=2017146 RepID=A0A554LW81_9BACT|nr:MAG: hypothetical protein CEN88_156 [Candidatus Berkelbacteria bacterium Licking1014_2]
MFDKAKQMYSLAKKAKEMQKELKATEVEASSNDNSVKVILTGEMKVKAIEINENELKPENKRQLEEKMSRVFNEAISRSQAISASRAKEMMGDLGINIPGM